MKLPRSMYFTFKFYTYRQITTDVVVLKTKNDLQNNDFTLVDPEPSTDYFLVPQTQLPFFSQHSVPIEQILDCGMKRDFDVAPSKDNANEHARLARHLATTVMTIFIWDGEQPEQHYGEVRVPLSLLLRQN